MGLQINTVKPQIAINVTRPGMSISQPKGELYIETTKTKLNIDSELPKLIIDQYECFAEAGLKNYIDLTKENARHAGQKIAEAISRYIDDGNSMANISKNSPDMIPELAENNAWQPQRQYDIGTLPKSRPKIDVTGSLDINWDIGKANISYKVNKPTIDIRPNKVEIYLQQKPSIDIRYIDDKA